MNWITILLYINQDCTLWKNCMHRSHSPDFPGRHQEGRCIMVYPGRTLLMAGIHQSIDEWTEGLIKLSMSNIVNQDGEHLPRFPQLPAAAFLRSCQQEFFHTLDTWCILMPWPFWTMRVVWWLDMLQQGWFDIIFAHMFQNRSHSNSGIIGSRRLVIHSVTMPHTKPNFLRRRTDGDLSATFYLQGLSPVPLEGAGLRPGGPIASRQKMKRASSNLSSFMRPMPLLPYQRGPESPVLPEVPPSNSIKVDVEVPESCLPNLKALQRRSTLPTLDLRSEALMLSRQLHLDFHEVKFVLQELRSESTLPTGGLDYTTFSQCLQRICGVELEDKWIGTAYKECHGSEGEIDSEQLLIWYRDHIFDLEACKRKRRFASGTAVPQVTLDLAKRFHCSCLDLDKVKVKFDDFDLDKSGYIDHYEFEKMLYQLLNCSSQSDFPKARLQRFWNEADKNGDGQIDFEEFLEWYMKYFGTTYENGPMDAFYASFMPVLQRSNSFGELKSHECCLQSIHVRWVEPWLGFHLHPASSLGGLSLKTQF